MTTRITSKLGHGGRDFVLYLIVFSSLSPSSFSHSDKVYLFYKVIGIQFCCKYFIFFSSNSNQTKKKLKICLYHEILVAFLKRGCISLFSNHKKVHCLYNIVKHTNYIPSWLLQNSLSLSLLSLFLLFFLLLNHSIQFSF